MVEGKPDAETAALAEEIAGELPAFTDVENPDPVLTPEQKAAEEREAKASKPPEGKKSGEGEDKPPVSKQPPGEGEGEGEGGEPAGEGEQEDPLKVLVDDDGFLKVLLEHPTLGPKLQHWSDLAGDAQVQSALESERPTIEARATRTAAERQDDEHFSAMSQQEIADEIAGDDKAATAYSRFKERQEAAGQPDADGIARASQVYAYAARIAEVGKVLNDSDLSAETKAELDPKKFTHLKAEGIVAWGSAVFQALVDHESGKKAQTLHEEQFEAYKEEHLAEIDGERPATARGRGAAPTPDLMGTDSSELLEGALSQPQKKGSKA